MKNKIISVMLSAVLITLFFVSCGPGDTTGTVDTSAQKVEQKPVAVLPLDKAIPALMEKADIPGMSMAIIDNSKIVSRKVFGVKNTKTKAPVTGDTLFEAASLTKPVLAYTALKLVDEGKLELDKPLYQYFEYKDIQHDERYKLITARIVLKHSSGFPNWRTMNNDKKLDIKFTPGEKFSYSGEGYVFLQRVIEKITGKKLREIVKEKVFIPLNMNNSALVLKDAQQCATGHTPDMKPQKKRIPKRANGAASLHTTAEDYARFLIAVADGDGLAVKTREEMLRPQISISDDAPALSWGLGFALEKTAGDTVFWHWGDNGPFKAFTVVSMNKKKGFIYFANSTNGLSIMKEMNALLMDGKYSMYSWLDYPQLGDPEYVFRKMVADNQLEAAIKKYKEWQAKEPGRFKEHGLNSIGYFLLGKKKIKEAIEIFKLNVEAYPDSANVYDSLGEAYMKNGDKELAIKNYEKSVQLNPENHAGIEALKKLKM